jgi:hypothetical protein
MLLVDDFQEESSVIGNDTWLSPSNDLSSYSLDY